MTWLSALARKPNAWLTVITNLSARQKARGYNSDFLLSCYVMRHAISLPTAGAPDVGELGERCHVAEALPGHCVGMCHAQLPQVRQRRQPCLQCSGASSTLIVVELDRGSSCSSLSSMHLNNQQSSTFLVLACS